MPGRIAHRKFCLKWPHKVATMSHVASAIAERRCKQWACRHRGNDTPSIKLKRSIQHSETGRAADISVGRATLIAAFSSQPAGPSSLSTMLAFSPRRAAMIVSMPSKSGRVALTSSATKSLASNEIDQEPKARRDIHPETGERPIRKGRGFIGNVANLRIVC
jgi:hypothetical protein